jgi:DNA repair exonuclease SbcCD ATPase subunit
MNTTDTTNDNIIDGQITEVAKPDNALVILNPVQFATELFKPFEDQLASAKRAASRTKYDVTTKDGMTKAKELRATFVTIRTTADKAKIAAKRPIDESGKLILAHFNKLAEAAKAEEAKHDQAIRDEEARIEAEKQRKLAEERARIEAIEGRIAHIRSLASQLMQSDSATLAAKIEELATKRLEPSMYDEHLEDAVNALNTAVDDLRALHQAALAREAEARRVAAEREELARLRAEQERRDAEERQRQAEAEAAAAEQQRKMEAQQAEIARQNRIMQDIQSIQQIGMREGDARALLDNLEYAQAIVVDADRFNGMAPMAQMAKDMAITSLTSKYNAQLALELPLAHEEALAKHEELVAIERQRNERTPMRLVEVPDENFGRAYAFAPAETIEAQATPDAVPTEPTPEPLAPSTIDIVDKLTDAYREPRATIATWLLGLDQALLNRIIDERNRNIVESLK